MVIGKEKKVELDFRLNVQNLLSMLAFIGALFAWENHQSERIAKLEATTQSIERLLERLDKRLLEEKKTLTRLNQAEFTGD